MTALVDPAAVVRFREAIVPALGLSFEDAKLGFLGEVLQRRLEATRSAPEVYLAALEMQPAKAEIGRLAEALTVGETYFFRNNDQFRAFAEVVLPERMRANAASRRLRFLSAGCSSGEEAYTLAITIRTVIADPSWQVSIRAVDANPAVLKKATAARYSNWALRETPAEVQQRWFSLEGRDAVLDQSVRDAVVFEERNLAVEDFELWQPESYDAIFCRNALMYFAPASARRAMTRMTRSLVRGGFLFLGHAETMRGLSNDFHLRHTHDTFYYQRRDAGDDGALLDLDISTLPLSVPPLAPPLADDSWVGAIGRATDRVTALAQRSVDPAPAPLRAPSWNLGLALDLLQRERFADALTLIERLPPESGNDPDVLLLQAVLLAHSGQSRLAGETALRLLAIDEMNAGANYVMALCFESAGDRITAANHYRVAVYLDPTFAMPRLHLGLLLRRAGDFAAARRELEQALALLEREDSSRLLLFGSGFTRDALIAMGQSELERCAARS
ncbi:MAG: protein-glutamate O-methyltransferase CheR [Bauldia sp.]